MALETGKLDQRIAIQRVTTTTNDMGGLVETWTTLATVWAEVRAVGGAEAYEAMRTTGRGRYSAMIRWRGDDAGQPYFTPRDRVVWRGREYGIAAVLPKGGRNEALELVLHEGDATG